MPGKHVLEFTEKSWPNEVPQRARCYGVSRIPHRPLFKRNPGPVERVNGLTSRNKFVRVIERNFLEFRGGFCSPFSH
jgi:hypothetical protein